MNLLIVGAIWVLSRRRRTGPGAAVLSVLLALVAFMGFSVVATVVKIQVAAHLLPGPLRWQTAWALTSNLFICVAAIWSFFWIKPWKGVEDPDEPLSPSTRKSKKLFGLSGLAAIPGTLVLYYGTFSKEHPAAMFSNSQVPLWVALFAITSWLLSQAINKWWWYFSADEHERRADDFGNLLGWALFMIVTPAWWVASRAGLLPHMDAMVLWLIAVWISAIGYFWRKSH